MTSFTNPSERACNIAALTDVGRSSIDSDEYTSRGWGSICRAAQALIDLDPAAEDAAVADEIERVRGGALR